MSLAIRLMPEPVRTLGFAAIGAAYMGVGTAMTQPIRMLLIQNLTNQLVMFSFDGIDDHIPMPANGYLILDIAANKTSSVGFFLAEGQRLYVKHEGAAPTTGSVYFTTFYGAQ